MVKNKKVSKRQTITLTTKVKNYDIYAHLDQLHKMAIAFPSMSKHYNKLLVELANNTQIRLQPAIKHSYCKHCFQSTQTGEMDIQNNVFCIICSNCKKIKKLKNIASNTAK